MEEGESPLFWAVWNGHEAVVRQLLAMDRVNVNDSDNYGRTPLSCAARCGCEAVVKLLLATGKVDVDAKALRRYSP
jgi:ankyrin repeat protein